MGIFKPPDIEKLKTKRDIKGLKRALKHTDANIRKQVINALEEIGDTSTIEILTTALTDKEREIRYRVTEILSKMGWKPESAAEKMVFLIAQRNWDDLVKLPVDTLTTPQKELSTYTVSEHYVMDYMIYLISALWEIGEPAVPQLINILGNRDKDVAVRTVVATALGVIGDLKCLEPLTTIFRDKTEDEGLRESTAIALQCMGESAMKPMILALTDSDSDRQISAARNLASIGKPAIEDCTKALQHEDPNVRTFAALALASSGDPHAIGKIKSLEADQDMDIRQTVTDIQHYLNPPSLDSFISFLQLNNAGYRIVAVNGLGNLGDPRAAEPLFKAAKSDANEAVRSDAFFSLAKIISSPEVKKKMIDTLGDEDPATRFPASLVLLMSGISVLREL